MSSAQQLRCCWRSLSPFRVYPGGVPCQCHRSYQGSPTPPGRSCLSKPLLTLKFLHLPRVPVQCHPAQPAPAPAFPGTPGVSQLAHQGVPALGCSLQPCPAPAFPGIPGRSWLARGGHRQCHLSGAHGSSELTQDHQGLSLSLHIPAPSAPAWSFPELSLLVPARVFPPPA